MAYLKEGIRINAICPGPTDTPLAQALHGHDHGRVGWHQPQEFIGRLWRLDRRGTSHHEKQNEQGCGRARSQ